MTPTWLQLTAEAADSTLTPGQMTAVDVALTQTSADVAASCAMPDGIPTAYAAIGGTMSPLDGELISGLDQSTFTAGSMDGLHAAFVALDAELLAVAIDIDASETDLSVTMMSTPEQAAPNDTITFTALVANLGPSDALKSRGGGSAAVASAMTDSAPDNNTGCSIVFSIFTDIFADGFELGDTSAWSATVN